MRYNKEQKIELYLDWTNNFLTVACFAEYYGITELRAGRIILEGRKLHHEKARHEMYLKSLA